MPFSVRRGNKGAYKPPLPHVEVQFHTSTIFLNVCLQLIFLSIGERRSRVPGVLTFIASHVLVLRARVSRSRDVLIGSDFLESATVYTQAFLLPAGTSVGDQLQFLRCGAVDAHTSIPPRVGADAETFSGQAGEQSHPTGHQATTGKHAEKANQQRGYAPDISASQGPLDDYTDGRPTQALPRFKP